MGWLVASAVRMTIAVVVILVIAQAQHGVKTESVQCRRIDTIYQNREKVVWKSLIFMPVIIRITGLLK